MKQYFIEDIFNFEEGKDCEIYGWIHDIRDLGGLKFLLIRDRTGIIQVTVKKTVVSKEVLDVIEKLGSEDVVHIKGTVKKDPRAPNGVEVILKEIELLNKAQRPLPLDVSEKVEADVDTRFDHRILDLRKPKIQTIFKIRSQILKYFRDAFRNKGFIEVYTPKIIASASEGGTALFPVLYYNKEAFLSQSPQLYKQALVIAGFEQVFEITPIFRAEESHTYRHLSESNSIDMEMAWANLEDIIKVHKDIVLYVIEKLVEECEKELERLNKTIEVPEIVEIEFDEAKELTKGKVENRAEDDLSTDEEKYIGQHFGNALVYIKHYPKEARPFYTVVSDDGVHTESFDCLYKGLEICSGSERINDHETLKNRIVEEGLNPENFKYYLEMFKYGAPPHGGWATGLERFTMQLLDINHIREVIFFPRTPNRLSP